MKWDRAIIQQNSEVESFAANFLAKPGRRCALILGAGFDPRTLILPKILRENPCDAIQVLCLREERRKAQPRLRPIADRHEAALKEIFPKACTVQSVKIFDDGAGVVGGRAVIPVVNRFLKAAETGTPLTDILVDISALSCGIFFPIVALILKRIEVERPAWNLHLFVAENPRIDLRIRGEINDSASQIHGYFSTGSLPQAADHSLLWVPVFAEDNGAQMRKIFDSIRQSAAAIDIMPIIPFPGLNPRQPDLLVERYRELIGDWRIDPRHFLYAAESDPLDSYRSLCEIDRERTDRFCAIGGASTIVSPLGSKMLSVGLMLAAIERDLRVLYVETLGYEELAVPDPSTLDGQSLPIKHIWLAGEIYGGL